MKKLLFAFLMLFAMIGLFGCNNEPVDIDMTDFVTAPTNLAISGTTLTWDAVEGAKGYIIYVNREEKTTVKTNSYSFGSLEGDVLVFNVQTEAPSGMENSPLSVSIAYMVNKTQEISQLNTVLSDNWMEVPEGFAEELANKGMTSEELDQMITDMQTLVSAVQNSDGDVLVINTAMKTFLEANNNSEPLISAFLVTMVPGMLTDKITQNQEDIDYYEGLIEDDSYYEYWYRDTIDQLQAENDMYQSLLTMLEESGDDVLMALTQTADYLISFQAAIDNEFISKITDLMDSTTDFESLNPEEVIIIKDEFVQILRDNVPSMENMVLLFQVVDALSAMVEEQTSTTVTLPDYTTKYAAETILYFQAGIEFIDTFDLDFVTEVRSLGMEMAHDQPEMMAAEFGILFTKYVDKYLNDNQDLMDQIDAVFTETEKAEMFNAYVEALSSEVLSQNLDSSATSIITSISKLTYDQANALYDVIDTASDTLLDSFVAADGEIVRQIVIMNGYQHNYNYDRYENTVTGTIYDNEDDYDLARNLTAFQIINELFVHLGAVADELTDADMTAIVDFIMVVLPFDMLVDEEIFTTTELANFKANIETLLTDQLPNLLELGQNYFEFVNNEDMMDTLITEFPDWPLYPASTQYASVDYVDEALIIFFAGYYNDFMNNANQGLVDDISSAIFDFMRTAEFLKSADMLTTDVGDLETAFNDAFDFTISETDVLKDYDINNLTLTQLDRVDSFFPNVGNYFQFD